MRKILLVTSCVAVAGCTHLTSLVKSPFRPSTTVVCSHVETPPEDPLTTFKFYPLAAGTKAADGTALQAGVTTDSIKAILDNHATLQKREREWRGRASAVNKCLDTEATQRGK